MTAVWVWCACGMSCAQPHSDSKPHSPLHGACYSLPL